MTIDLQFKPPSATGFKKFLVYFLFFGNLAFIAYLWFVHSNYYIMNPGGGNLYIAIGRILGLWGELFLLVELVLIGRIHWLEGLFGFDRLNMIHRWIGYSILGLLLAHPLFLTVGYAESNAVSFISQFQDFLANTSDVLLAVIALLLFLYIVFISVAVRKRVHYEVWYFSHLLTYVAIGLALPHQLGTADLLGNYPLYYWYVLNFAVFGLVLVYRFLMPLVRFAYHRFTVASVVEEAPGVTSIYITGRHMERFKFQAGQYANINLLARGMWYTHPFSFSAAYNGTFIRFTIKNAGGYTAKIATVKPGTRVIIDGPLGLFVEKRATREKYLLIAGGIGITPLRAMLEPLARDKKDVILLVSARTTNDIIFSTEITELQQIDPAIKVHYIVSTPTPGYEPGRLNKEKIVRLVPDFFEREVFVCGPPPMMQSIVKDVSEIGLGPEHVHFENFAF
jgi:predicted ferric reductase